MGRRVVVATDGSLESLEAARALPGLLDAGAVEEVVVVAVLSPTAAVPFRDEIGAAGRPGPSPDPTAPSYRQEAESAAAVVAAALGGWPGRVRAQVRSGAAASTRTVLLGSTAMRVQHSAPCPVLVWRPTRY